MESLFEETCDRLRRPDGSTPLAVDAPAESLTYDELDRRANGLARYLLAGGTRAGDRVALLLDHAVSSYTAMLAVLKLRAAYVPLDAGFPDDRIEYILDDAAATTVLTLSHLAGRVARTGARVVCLDEAGDALAGTEDSRLQPAPGAGADEDLAYIIYTSGSTGRPKGVAVEHASICNFLRVAGEVYGYEPTDRVYQGMTIAFDFSVEEIWVPWMVGATLVPRPGGASLLGLELATYLRARQITALCCVPTLLATLEEDLPGLRFLLVSGEACPRDLVARWHRPGRRFLNVYGPTEATVTATWDEVHPDKPVTLGVPLPTYSAVILHPEEARALPPGEMGEIGIAGVGLARGYVGRDDLTRRAFVPDFLGMPDNPTGRIYRTGDLGRLDECGRIEYHGRIDTQVKVRGYRIELSEIESVLLQAPGVAQAVVSTHEPRPGVVELAAYYTARRDVPAVEDELVRRLRERLPGYMVPAYLERLETIPMLPSGKADRKSLPPPTRRGAPEGDAVPPATPTEEALARELADVLGLERVSVEAHFFEELGLNSLVLAHFAARVRQHTALPPLAIQDLYQHPSVRRLAGTCDAAAQDAAGAAEDPPAPERPVAQVSTGAFVLCGALQVVAALAYAYFLAVVLYTGVLWAAGASGLVATWLRSTAFGLATFLVTALVPVALKWLLVGRWTEREFPVWSLPYVRLWFLRVTLTINPMRFFVATPLYPLYLRALGAHIGRQVTILSATPVGCPDLLTIGDRTVIRKDTDFRCYRAEAGRIQTGPVTVGADVLVGEQSVLDIGTAMGDHSQLGHSSSLHRGQVVPAGEHWHGSPARRTDTDYDVVPPAPCSTRRRALYGAAVLANRFLLLAPLAFLVLGLVLPDYYAYLAVGHLRPDSAGLWAVLLLASVVLFVGGLAVLLVVAVVVPRLLNTVLVPGRTYPLYGFPYALHRAVWRLSNNRLLMRIAGDSSLVVHYLRLLGYRQPGLVQTGSNFGVALQHENPHLTVVGSGTMVSDALSVLNTDYSSTSFRGSPTVIGARNFLGNNITFPTGARTGDNCLLATKVMVPVDGPVREGVGLLGSPPFEIPRTVERDRSFDDRRTAEGLAAALPGKNAHNAVTLALYLLAQWLRVFVGLVVVVAGINTADDVGPLALVGSGVGLALFTVGSSILLENASRRFRPLEPLFCSIYDPRFWRHERHWKFFGESAAIFNGTPFKPLVWRLLGVHVGRRVFDDGAGIVEKTLVTIGDRATLNAGSDIQCHSMEDGAFKLDAITIGADTTLGVRAFVHYGVTVGRGAMLAPDSFLMKGTEVPAGARYGGNPARPLVRTAVRVDDRRP
ncbi:amino acid adenylation domain-containing protein [Georgenia thermotolerans]|uniref:Amino acid adenylation domain-containing protein n=2 Tax=Georgenia thermotolerans TaxID=527326 RepID=A0A7J5ULZ0_9MICO|nr:amino acid adenylation domain-containing protein [Georgenia thermotolerans]